MKAKEKKPLKAVLKKMIFPEDLIFPFDTLDKPIQQKICKDSVIFFGLAVLCLPFVFKGLFSAMVLFVSLVGYGLVAFYDTYYAATRNHIVMVHGVVTAVTRGGYRKQYYKIHIQDDHDRCYFLVYYEGYNFIMNSKSNLQPANEVTFYVKDKDLEDYIDGEYHITKTYAMIRNSSKIVDTQNTGKER